MSKSTTSIIKHILLFLDYYKNEGYSVKTQESYKRFLNKFIVWLKKTNKQDLKPHELTTEDIWAYKLYLSHFQDSRGKPLKKATQNYYLIALRAILSYFVAKDWESITPDKIALLKDIKGKKTIKFLNLDQIKKLLLAPNIKTESGLRDRVILETIISTGFKIKQLVDLNRTQLNNISSEALLWIKDYLKSRKDQNKALFINYKARKHSIGDRLSARSIERIVNKYGKKVALPFLITPEILRWARAHAILDIEIEIKTIYKHKVVTINNYNHEDINNREKVISNSPTWHTTENIIKKELFWLKDNILVLPERYKEDPVFLKCDECILRKLAILITSGNIKAIEFQSKNGKNLWDSFIERKKLKNVSRHGKEWHKKIMDMIYEYFIVQEYKVILEPSLNYGRADLGVYLKSNKPIYIEVGTISLFKLWYNLSTMENTTFLIIPSENRIIEFNT